MKKMRSAAIVGCLLLLSLMMNGCGLPQRLLEEGLPVELPEIPGIPDDLQSVDGLLRDLGLPDLSTIADLPGVDALPGLQSDPGQLVYRGPVERVLAPGEQIVGTDIVLVEVGESSATFTIAGMRSERRLGDSLDFDGEWPGAASVTYHARLRIYRIGANQVRAAGVHQLVISDSGPTRGELAAYLGGSELEMRFPYTTQVGAGETFGGLTFGYGGEHERGAELTGLDGDSYPYRKLGDSIVWEGRIRSDIPAAYNLRLLYYGQTRAQIGGVVTIYLQK